MYAELFTGVCEYADADEQTMIMIIIFMVIINIIIQLKQITRALVLFIGRQ